MKEEGLWRARWDLNPRSPAPKADTLIRARLRAHIHHLLMGYVPIYEGYFMGYGLLSVNPF